MNKYEEALKELKKQFPNKLLLSLTETAKVLTVSVGTLRRGIKLNRGIPSYKKIGSGEQRQTVAFPITEVARYIVNTEQVF